MEAQVSGIRSSVLVVSLIAIVVNQCERSSLIERAVSRGARLRVCF